ncbi:hypothetical protein LLH00_01280 [bacterium]|nr:hypothetical protein [bacterium]
MKNRQWSRFYQRLQSGQLLVLSFFFTIAAGSVLLWLPWSVKGEGIHYIDALFTATSAVCVTGLSTVDTGTTFTLFGKLVLLGLIQVGGLGIMTFSVLMFLTVGRLPALRDRWLVENMYSQEGRIQVLNLVRTIFAFTFIAEALGAVGLFVGWFRSGMPLAKALWYGVFHSVSAFCNAGFAFFPNNFENYVGDWWINLSTCSLIISGGIGFSVLYELFDRYILRCRRRLSLHTRLVLYTTLFLLAVGALGFYVLEVDNTLLGMGPDKCFMASLFQSTTARTAGFNTIRISALSNGTLLIIILLMFIGASPGSCGGGVRTTSLALLVIFFVNRVKGSLRTNIFGRTVPEETIGKVVMVILLGVLAVVGITLLLLLTQGQQILYPRHRDLFLGYLFECVSALGTVGLSMGVTSSLNHLGKLLIVALMFVGRVGLVTLAYGMVRPGKRISIEYGSEDVMI